MCGIIGITDSRELKNIEKALDLIKYRGKDAKGIYKDDNIILAHRLHSIVNKVKQPIKNKGILISNCEIYNWKKLNKKYNLKAKNDSELLLKLLDKKGFSLDLLEELDGVYAFAYYNKEKLYLARDILGIKPLWYSFNNFLSFASEKKALEFLDIIDINELNPRHVLIYNIKNKKAEFLKRDFFKITPEIKHSKKTIIKNLKDLLKSSVKKRIPNKKIGILFSGGIDSTLIAFILKNFKKNFTLYTTYLDEKNFKESQDLTFSKKIAEKYNLKLKTIPIKINQIEKYLRKIVPLIEDNNVVKTEVALTLFLACEQAKKDNCKVIFSGLGSEEIFAGYQRHKNSLDINKECLSGLLKIYERDLYRDDVISMYNNLEIRLPFLDKELVKYSLKIPQKYKIKNIDKYILRETAKEFKLPKEIINRPKKAAQYGSNIGKAITKLAKDKTKSEYLLQFYPTRNLKLASLVSSGKDSMYATYVMLKQNYDIKCLVSIKSKNPDSYMFHTPNIDIIKLQSSSIGIPLIYQETKGEKEIELEDLKKALEKAKTKYKIQGVITGALFSNYQRERIEKICDSLQLKIFSPLWHLNQEQEIREILNSGFKFIITQIAAEGLDKTWLGREIIHKDIDYLVDLNKKIGINIAFEGGEAETLMIDGPMFKKPIKIEKYKIIEESENIAKMVIQKAS